MEAFLEILAPVVAALVAAMIPVLVAALVQWFKKLGIDIEAKHRDALQSALTNAAMIALTKRGSYSNEPGLEAIEYVRHSVPDAVKRFGLDEKRIGELLLPHLTAAKVQAGKSIGH